MSRIGRMPITVPAGVTVNVAEGNVVTVKGPKGEITRALRPEMIIKQDGNTITVERPSEDKLHKSLHGLTRTLLHNMVEGVTHEFSKELEVNGVGYRVAKEGKTLVSASSLDKEIEGYGGNVAAATAVGKLVAERAKAKGIDTVVFDRGGYLYHGRVAELAEGAREGGLEF